MGAAVPAPVAVELCTAKLRTTERKGQPCQARVIRDGLCKQHLSAPKIAATMRGRLLTPQAYIQGARPEVRARAAHSISMYGLASLAESKSATPWARWAAQRMVDLDLGKHELAESIGCSGKTIYNLLHRRGGAGTAGIVLSKKMLARLEAVLGPLPASLRLTLKGARSERAGGKLTQRRLRLRMAKWNREKLEREITKLGGPPLRESRVKDELSKLPRGKALGLQAYKIYHVAKAEAMRHKGRKVNYWEFRSTPNAFTPKGNLKQILAGLKRRRKPRVFQCHGCGDLWVSSRSGKQSDLCGPCWCNYQPSFSSWMAGGRIGPRPSPPRQQGRLIPDGRELEERIIFLIRQALLDGTPTGASLDTDYKTLNDTRRRIRESSHAWCQRLTALLSSLSVPTERSA